MTDRLFSRQWKWVLLRYLLAGLAGGAAAGLRLALIPVMGTSAPYVLLFTTIVIVAVSLGTGPGLLAAAIGVWAGEAFLLEPLGEWSLTWASGLRIAFILLGAIYVGYVGNRLRAARRSAEAHSAELARATDEWERTFNAVPDLIALIDPQHRIIRANRAMAERLGTEPKSCAGEQCYACVHGTDAPPSYCPHEQVLADGREHTAEVYEPKLGGHFLITCTPLTGPQGQLIGTVHVAHDITERQEMEKSLRESVARFHSLADAMPQIVWTATPDGKMDYFNARTCEYSGCSSLDLEGLGWQQIIHPDDLAHTLDVWRAALATGDIQQVEHRLRRADGAYRWHLSRAVPAKDGNGKVARWFGTATDIDDLKSGAQRLEGLADELRRSNQDLEQFAYVASHDLQEPLRVVTGYLDLLRVTYTGHMDQNADTFIRYAFDASKRMQQLIQDLLAYSRVGSRAAVPQPTAMEKLVSDVLENQRLAIAESGATVTHGPLPTVWADATQLTQVLNNLIGNALKFHKKDETPRIHIAAERRGREWLFSVKDNGIGIDPKFRERVFLIFQRLHDQTKYPGSGIGLAICKKIIERHGGQMCVESQKGEGATFLFTIPDQQE